MIRVYVAGPITDGESLDEETRAANIARHILAGNELRKAGLHPFVPALYEVIIHMCDLRYEEIMALCLEEVRRSEAVLRLPGASKGADAEVQLARSLGMPVFGTVVGLRAWARGRT